MKMRYSAFYKIILMASYRQSELTVFLGIPLTYIYEDERIYFHSAPEGHKLDNIDYCNKTSFCVIGNTELLPEQSSTKYECVIAFGDIQELVAAQKRNSYKNDR